MNTLSLLRHSLFGYYSFGMVMPGRQTANPKYRYGMTGQEKDVEITGNFGTHYTAKYWEYDARIGRRWNVDPVTQISYSNYSVFGNSPIINIDLDGAEYTPAAQIEADKVKSRTAELRKLDQASLDLYKRFKRSKMSAENKQEIKNIKERLKEYNKIDKEINAMKKSRQVYDFQIVSDEADFDGKTSFDAKTGYIVMSIRSGAYENGAVYNEFTHAYQFESGQISFVYNGINNPGGMIYDSYDEYMSDKREMLLRNTGNSFNNYTYSDYLLNGEMKMTTEQNGVTSTVYFPQRGPVNLNSKNSSNQRYRNMLSSQIKKWDKNTTSYEVMIHWQDYTNILGIKKP